MTFTAAATPAEHAMVFASLGEPALVEHLRARSMVQDTEALAAAFDQGLFRVREPLEAAAELAKHAVDKEAEVYRLTDEIVEGWAPRLSAVTAFLRNGTMERLAADPVLGTMPEEREVLVMGATAEFRALFETLALEAVDQLNPIVASKTFEPWIRDGRTQILDRPFALLAAGAVVMDLPHVVTRIVERIPESAVTCLDSSLMGPEFHQLVRPQNPCRVTVACVALQFSRLECLEALQATSEPVHGVHHNLVLGQIDLGQEHAPYELRFAENLHEQRIAMACTPTALRWGLQHAMDSAKEESVRDIAFSALEHPGALHAYVPAFLAAGCYDQDVTHVVREASHYGVVSVIQGAGNPPLMRDGQPEAPRRVEAVDWAVMVNSYRGQAHVLYKMLKAIVNDKNGPVEAAHALVQRAEREGGLAYLFRSWKMSSDHSQFRTRAEPMHFAILAQQPQIVVAMLNAGVSATQPQFPGVLSPLDMAQRLNAPAVAHAIQSWGLRNAALSLLDSLDEPTPKAAP